jgi:hypothetical protein
VEQRFLGGCILECGLLERSFVERGQLAVAAWAS